MKPINYLNILFVILFSMWISGSAMAHGEADQNHDAAELTHEAANNITQEETSIKEEVVNETPEVDSQVIARAQFTTKVVDREPVDQIDQIDSSVSPVYFFTELTNLSGKTVTHRWLYNGTKMADVKIAVNGDRWRAHSTKNMMPNWTGPWTVAVFDEEGNEITRKTFEYSAPVKTADMSETKKAME